MGIPQMRGCVDRDRVGMEELPESSVIQAELHILRLPWGELILHEFQVCVVRETLDSGCITCKMAVNLVVLMKE